MVSTRETTDPDECAALWRALVPPDHITDLWEVRLCFDRAFGRPRRFVVAEQGGAAVGLLPLSLVEEGGYHAYFPGETFEGRTWLEPNVIPAASERVLRRLLNACPGRYELRYLLPRGPVQGAAAPVDEVGYLFIPGRYGYDMENYWQEFSRKSRKRIRREVDELSGRNMRVRTDRPEDLETLIGMNVQRYGARSYFSDRRFRRAFRSLCALLEGTGRLRMTSVYLDGQPAAVDMGCLYRGVYTLVAGGTNPDFPGVAKLINVHHMERACRERVRWVDFLCGSFSWKELFHLAQRPLHVLGNRELAATPASIGRSMARVG
jgi:CelD/BcsL family acetyltransferase involved in cellulose biosynthesis